MAFSQSGGKTMGKIIAVTNQKGGVGKTTSSINISAALAYLGYKVLLVDVDSQANASTGVGIYKGVAEQTIFDLLIDDLDPKSAVLKTSEENLYLIPSSQELSGIDSLIMSDKKREFKLKDKLDLIKDDYDFIIIDCPPSLGLLTINALTAADSTLIPVQCEYYALEGLTQLLNTIRIVQKRLNPNLAIEGVLLTMLDPRTRLGKDVIDEVKLYFKEKVFNTIIPRLVRLSEAPSFGKSIIDYDLASKGSQYYIDLAREVVKNNGK